jgi:hypothetical protein
MTDNDATAATYRRYSPADFQTRRPFRDGSRIQVPVDLARSSDSNGCPPAIIDTDPEGHGLGVWVLVAEHPDEEFQCEYEYAGGIV